MSKRHNVCKFVSTQTKKVCNDPVEVSWGFCKRHSETLQGQRSKEKSEMDKLTIRKNKWGLFEDKSSHLLFNPRTKVVYGYQERDGTVRDLDEDDIELCERRGWEYSQPTTDSEGESDISESESDGSYTDSEDESLSCTESDCSDSEDDF